MSVPRYTLLVLLTSLALHIALKVGVALSPHLHSLVTSLTMVLVFLLGDAGFHDCGLEITALVIWWSCYFAIAAVLVGVFWRLLPEPAKA